MGILERVEKYDIRPGQESFVLRGSPVVGVATVKNDRFFEFGAGTDIAAKDFDVDDEAGIIYIPRYTELLTPGVRALEVTYTAGMASGVTASSATASFIDGFADISGAIDRQCAHYYQRRRAIGSLREQTGGSPGAGVITLPPPRKMLPELQDAIRNNRRDTF